VNKENDMSGHEVTVRFGRRSTRGLLLGFSAPRVVALGVALTIALIGLTLGNGHGFGLSGLIWVPLGITAFVRVAGRPAVEWGSTVLHYGTRQATGQNDYRAVHPTKPRPAGTLALPGDAAPLRLHNDLQTGAVMIHDPHRQTLTAITVVSHPAFVLLDPDDRGQRVSGWARVYAGLAQTGTCAAIQVLEATVPDPATGQDEWYADHGTHDGGWADAEYVALLEQVRLAAGTHRTTISLSLDMRAAARAIKAAGRGLAGATTVMRADMASLADSLRQAGLQTGGWLTEPQLATIVRSAYDPAAALDPRHDPGANLTHAGPLALREHWESLQHDSAFSAVLWVSEWPRIDVPVDFLHPLIFAPGVRRTLSLIARPLPADAALRQIRKEKTEAASDMAQKQRVGQIAELSDAQEYEDLLTRERSVVAGHTDVEFSGFIVVTAPTMAALDSARAVIIRAAAQAACEVRPLYGRQAQGFVLAALPLARTAF
jgi:hypothetical protein